MSAKDFEVGDLVWAQMRNYPPWPSKIAEPPADAKVKDGKAQHWVYFFGSKNYAWIPNDKIFPHGEEMLQKAFKNKSAVFRKAVEEIVSESKALRKQICQENNNTNSNEIPVKMKNKNKPLKAKKSVLVKKGFIEKSRIKKKFLIKESRKKCVPEFVFIRTRRKNDSDCSPAHSSNILDIELSSSENKCNEDDARSKEKKIKNPPNVPTDVRKKRKYIIRPSTPPLDIKCVQESLKAKDVKPTSYKIGFLGLGAIGQRMVMNLLNSGHDVTVWSRTPEKRDVFVEAGAHSGLTPADVIQACDITFSCVSDPNAAKTLVFGNCGVLKGLESCTPGKKGYVELTGIDPQTSQEIANEISKKGGRYLEAQIYGSRSLAGKGLLVILAAGDISVFHACESCFRAISKHTYFLDLSVGKASTMSLILSMFNGIITGALAETVSLVNSCKLNIDHFLEILAEGPASCPLVKEKGKAMRKENFTTNFAIKHQQRHLSDAIALGNSVNQPLKITAAANEIFKLAKLRRYSDHDVSAVIQAIRY